jgi:hypothetical protein
LPAIGDKMASRCGQKGTIGLIIPEEDMPFTADGVRPDLIINPHAIPSRMTIGQLVECVLGKAGCVYGGYGDCTAFATKGSNYDTYGHMLTKMGYHNSGNQLLYNGFTGEQIYSEIFIGPTYYMRLKHMVKDKINYRATGKRNFLTRQTNQGRANDGGLKIGEMERDGIMAHGLSYFLNESYMVRGDQYFMGVCNKTGAIAVYNPDTNLFLSPFADGPLVFNKNIEGKEVLNAISKFGRSFSIVKIPFALKLLIQELQVMNIQMRIITEDNIDQLMNLSYQSRNIDKLLHIDHGEDGKVERDIKDIVEGYRKSLEELTRSQFDKNVLPRYSDQEISPQNIEYTPEQQIPQNQPDSNDEFGFVEMGYNPTSDGSSTPQYAPYSPAYSGYNIDELLENNFPEQSLEDSQPWPPPFDIPEQNEIFYSLPKYVQDNIMKTVDDEMRWSVVNDVHKQILKEQTSFSSDITRGSSNVANVFDEPELNNAFNNLDGQRQSQILQLPKEQRVNVMREIIRRSQRGGIGRVESTTNPLTKAFNVLPSEKQVIALEEGYNSMAKEFNKLARQIPESFTTVTKPELFSDTFIKKFPLLAPEQKGGQTSSEDNNNAINPSTDNNSENNNSSSSNNNNNNNNSGIKTIKI